MLANKPKSVVVLRKDYVCEPYHYKYTVVEDHGVTEEIECHLNKHNPHLQKDKITQPRTFSLLHKVTK